MNYQFSKLSFKPLSSTAIYKSLNGESYSGMRAMMGTLRIMVEMRGIIVGMPGIMVGMGGIRLGMQGMGWECGESG